MNKPNEFSLSDPAVRARVSAEEWQARVDLAACYRLAAHYGWVDLIYTHISARVPGNEGHYLLNPFGYMFHEITASSLVKVDVDGNIVEPSPNKIHKAGFVIHSAVHAVRDDAACVLHTHTRAGVAVSAQACGVLPISQQSTFVLGSLAYHDYEGVALRDDEKPRLQADLGEANYLMLRNHGLLTVGKTIADAFLSMYTFENTCRIQIDAQAGGELVQIDVALPWQFFTPFIGQFFTLSNVKSGEEGASYDAYVIRTSALVKNEPFGVTP